MSRALIAGLGSKGGACGLRFAVVLVWVCRGERLGEGARLTAEFADLLRRRAGSLRRIEMAGGRRRSGSDEREMRDCCGLESELRMDGENRCVRVFACVRYARVVMLLASSIDHHRLESATPFRRYSQPKDLKRVL